MSEKYQNTEKKLSPRRALAIGGLVLATLGPVVYASIGSTEQERQEHAIQALGLMGEEALAGLGVVATAKVLHEVNSQPRSRR